MLDSISTFLNQNFTDTREGDSVGLAKSFVGEPALGNGKDRSNAISRNRTAACPCVSFIMQVQDI